MCDPVSVVPATTLQLCDLGQCVTPSSAYHTPNPYDPSDASADVPLVVPVVGDSEGVPLEDDQDAVANDDVVPDSIPLNSGQCHRVFPCFGW